MNPHKSDGVYSRSSLTGIRAGINRYIQNPPYNRINSIVSDRKFLPANKVLTGSIKINRESGHDVTKHKSAISSGDIDKLYSSGTLTNDNPVSLQNKVFLSYVSTLVDGGGKGFIV